jgi:anti-sigma factor RsiW
MSCAEREELLNAWVDGQLAPDARLEMDSHLAGCEGCRSHLDALRAQHREFEAAFAPESRRSSLFADRLAARFRRPGGRWRRAAIAACAAAAGFLLAVLLRPAPVADLRERAAWEALQAAHAFGHKNPPEQQRFFAICSDVANSHPGTAAAAAAARMVAEAAAQEEFQRELARLDGDLDGPTAREQFAEARHLLNEAKARRPEPLWAEELGRRRSLLDARIAAQGDACIAAAKAGEVKRHRERVAGWGIPEALARFDRDVRPVREPIPTVRLLGATGELLLKGPTPRKGDLFPLPAFITTRDRTLCALETTAGDLLRMNANSQVEIGADGKIKLWEGDLFVRCKESATRLEVTVGAQRVTAKDAVFEVSHRSVLRVTALEGDVEVDSRSVPIGPTEEVVLATQWMHPLLRGRLEIAGELMMRARALAGLLDNQKLGRAAESAVRALGPDAVPGLISLLEQEMGDNALRHRLAGLLADLAGLGQIPKLIEFLRDDGPALRSEAARGLKRLTGLTLGHPRTLWTGAGYERGAQSWEAWLQGPP